MLQDNSDNPHISSFPTFMIMFNWVEHEMNSVLLVKDSISKNLWSSNETLFFNRLTYNPSFKVIQFINRCNNVHVLTILICLRFYKQYLLKNHSYNKMQLTVLATYNIKSEVFFIPLKVCSKYSVLVIHIFVFPIIFIFVHFLDRDLFLFLIRDPQFFPTPMFWIPNNLR